MITSKKALQSFEEYQKAYCAKRGTTCAVSPAVSKLGFALVTEGKLPVNGLRHPVKGDTNGWYIWCGDQFSKEPDFFAPMHAAHLLEIHPELIDLLGLPPGYRFLVAGDYMDVWYDSTLLNV